MSKWKQEHNKNECNWEGSNVKGGQYKIRANQIGVRESIIIHSPTLLN